MGMGLLLGTLLATPAGANSVRRPAVAGFFYPAAKEELASLVDRYLEQVPPPAPMGEIVALICPHAGYQYSGKVAAHAYRQIRGRNYQVVVLIGPSHTVAFEGVALCDADYYQTPLGKVRLDRGLAQALSRRDRSFRFLPPAHEKEHSLEVQIPFLQRTLGEFSLLPLVMGSQSLATCQSLARALVEILRGKKALLIASSDLSHYHPSEVAKRLDEVAIEAIRSLDGAGLLRKVEASACELCGAGAVATVLLAARLQGADRVKILDYADSSAVAKDPSSVVGYLAAAIGKEDKEDQKESGSSGEKKRGQHDLSPEAKRKLLQLARQAIRLFLEKKEVWDPLIADPELQRPGAAFVTLTQGGELRGCIGTTEPNRPLYRTVVDCAIAAAVSDPRFPPLSLSELEGVRIEISVLGPLRRVRDASEIQVGRDGLMICQGERRGLLLPQVASRYGWDRISFLEQSCRKAGLPADAWRQGARIYRFVAEVFGEE
jgi:AmmeMemoRadiSam system protein B/AmmeMemoRadiSam system protein A